MSAADRKTIRVPADVHDALKREAALQGRTMIDTLRHALRVLALSEKWATIDALARSEDVSS